MLLPAYPLEYRKPSGRRKSPPPAPAPTGLTLVSATYDAGGPTVTLVFDRAVDISAYEGTEVHLDDGSFTGIAYDGRVAAILLNPVTVRIELSEQGTTGAAAVFLNAGNLTGIVAADDAQPWEGVVELELPFP